MSRPVEDFTPLVEKVIPENTKLALEDGQLHQAIENLLSAERQARQGNDAVSTGKLLRCITDLCFQAKDFNALKENLILLSKRRGQLKQAIKTMVKNAMTYLDQVDYDTKIDLINTLLKITEGKIFVEKQGARLSMMLAKIRESEGNIEEAARILQEVQVETFGSMKRKEKTDFILEQVRLCLAKKDYIRAQIVAKKISPKVLEGDDFEPLKIKYHNLMIDYYTHHEDYLNIFRSLQAIYKCKTIQENTSSKQLYLAYSVAYIILSPFDNEQSNLMNILNTDKNLESIPVFKDILKKFLTMEIIFWKDFVLKYRESFEQLPIITEGEERKTKFWEVLHVRVIEHNLRVIEKYYSRIQLTRLAELLDLTPELAEQHLCDLTIKKSIYARINRNTGEVNFIKSKKPSEILNEWSSDISSLLNVVEKTCHLIQREYMVHGQVQKS